MFVELRAAFRISSQAVEIRIDQSAPPVTASPPPLPSLQDVYIWLLSLVVFFFFLIFGSLGENT